MPIYGLHPGMSEATAYYSSPDKLRPGQYVYLETGRGPTVAKITSGPLALLPGANENELPPILRPASDEDMAVYRQNLEIAKKARNFCRERIKIRKMEMKLVNVEVFFDRSKYIFYFTAPGRIDFRELVKDLVAEYRARIELRQIGVRHETQLVGAIGNCGQVCCCHRFLRQFAPATIRMAKDQKLFLNPSKISGMCGRLLCCLAYEQDNYETFQKNAPRPGRKYQVNKDTFKVLSVDMFHETVRVLSESGAETEMTLPEWQASQPQRLGTDPQDMEGAEKDALE